MGAGDESDAVQPPSGAAGAEDLPALLDDLPALHDDLLALLDDLLALLDAAGGTLTRATLLNRFAQRSGCGWERGQELIRAGVAAGLLSIEAGDLVVRTVAPQ
jgi:hypothetical protein